MLSSSWSSGFVVWCRSRAIFIFFFFNDTATTEIYTLSLHDALPIFELVGRVLLRVRVVPRLREVLQVARGGVHRRHLPRPGQDRKSTRLNSSHSQISYAVFCLKKKKNKRAPGHTPQTTRDIHHIHSL